MLFMMTTFGESDEVIKFLQDSVPLLAIEYLYLKVEPQLQPGHVLEMQICFYSLFCAHTSFEINITYSICKVNE